MMKKIVLILILIGGWCSFAFAGDRPLTEKDMDIFYTMYPVMEKAISEAVKDFKATNAPCSEKSGCAANQFSAYKADVEKALAPLKISKEEFAYIHARVIGLYALVQSEELMRKAQESLQESSNSGIPPGLKDSLGGVVQSFSAQKQKALSKYSPDEIALIKKNKAKLDPLLLDRGIGLFNKTPQHTQ